MCVETKRAAPPSYLRKLSWRAYNKRLQAERWSKRGAWVVGWSTDKWVAVKKSAPRSQSKTRMYIYKRISGWSSDDGGRMRMCGWIVNFRSLQKFQKGQLLKDIEWQH